MNGTGLPTSQVAVSAILEYTVTCKKCRVQMKELKGHIYHKKRKWKCPKCNRVRMQEPKVGHERRDSQYS